VLPFLGKVFVISFSGALAPGPVVAFAVAKGNESPHAGALITVGHAIAEIVVMVLMFLGAGWVADIGWVRAAIGLAGAVVLALMGVGMLKALRAEVEDAPAAMKRAPVLGGVLLTITNPYFLVWWFTVGAALVLESYDYGILGFLLLVGVHLSTDLISNYAFSVASFGGRRLLGPGFQRCAYAVCGVALLAIAVRFVVSSVQTLAT